MRKKMELSLPIVCTRGVIVFPQQEVLIEVGRPKSTEAVYLAQNNYDGHIFIVSQNNTLIDDPSIDSIYKFGTLCRIKTIRKKKGYIRVTFTGLERASLIDFDDQGDKIMGTIKIEKDVIGDQVVENSLIKRIIKQFEDIAATANNLPTEIISQLSRGVTAHDLADQFGQYFAISLEKRQKLLETLELNDRLMQVTTILEDEKEAGEVDALIDAKVRERIEENQKEYYLREKMRAIKEELGDVSAVSDDTEEIRTMIENNPYPQAIKEKALEELKRYESLPAAAGESGVVRNYLDWLLKTPWWQKTEDNQDLNLVAKRLDDRHYGLDKVKNRIMEYLAVKQMTNSLNSPILCLVGPPGVGKTSLAKSIAESLDRKFVKMSLGGVKDESEIRGHRRTYLGSMPGRIIQGMKKAGVVNPVFLIDEIDKMGADFKGDPSSAMLEVLDPEQNKLFSDHYLEEAYDLSNVMFIATANYLQEIPAALQDRLEIIQLSSYTELEKLAIARQHLIEKQVKENGLKKSQFKIKDAELLYIIRHYTRESGVRQLERLIASLCRKTVLAILKDNKKSITITSKKVIEWLGKEKFEYGKKENANQIGVVTGLAYTSFGGDTLPVEVNYFPGKGKLIITGQLGDVMKESCSIALDFIKSHGKEFNIDPKFFDTFDIHIHVPEGAVPKDGPSAGVTITTALISAITKIPVYSNLAMTGEVTLRGNVLPIGGLREKSLAAHRVGITKICIPYNNLKDVDELPDVVKKDITFVPCKVVADVLKEALVK